MNERYSSLDGLRAFAAIGIAIMHILANIDVAPDFGDLSIVLTFVGIV